MGVVRDITNQAFVLVCDVCRQSLVVESNSAHELDAARALAVVREHNWQLCKTSWVLCGACQEAPVIEKFIGLRIPWEPPCDEPALTYVFEMHGLRARVTCDHHDFNLVVENNETRRYWVLFSWEDVDWITSVCLEEHLKALRCPMTYSIPETVQEAVEALDEKLCEEDKRALQYASDPEQVAVTLHHSLGRWIRNNWGLWQESKLAEALKAEGFEHPDDMSHHIIVQYVARRAPTLWDRL